MTFRPNDISRPSSKFAKNRAGSTRQYPKDRLVDVVSYNVAAGTMRVREDGTGYLLDVNIKPEVIASQTARRNDPSAARLEKDWEGYLIDARMAQSIPPGSRVVLQEATVERRNAAQHEGQEVTAVQARWIKNVKNPDKTFRAPYTITDYQGRVRQVQVWETKAINPEDPTGENQIVEIGDKLEENFALYQHNQATKDNPNAYKPYVSLGVRLRATVPGEPDKDGKPTRVVVDTTDNFEFVAGDRAAGTKGHPLTKERLFALIQEYMGYIYGDAENPAALADTPFAKADVRVEVMPYRSYRASDRETDFVTDVPSKPLYNLVNTPTRCSFTSDEPQLGGNWAVDGIVMLAGDKVDRATKTFTERNMVTALFTNGYRASVHNFVAGSEGEKVRMHPDLDRPALPANENGASNNGNRAPARSNAPTGGSPSGGSAPTGSAPPPVADPFAEENDPFANSFDTAPAVTPAAPAPVASAPAPAAPAPSAPAPAAPAPAAPAAPATGAGRFGRRG